MHKNIKQMIEYPKQGIMSKTIFRDCRKDISLFCMTKGSEMSQHSSSREAIIYVLEGKGVFNLRNKNISMLPGALIHMPKKALHSIKAEKNTSFLLVLM
ncbi:MAG: cupin domain-containing protein [Candidatus Aenigmarchaeota archaeon]|nr:cupin domain-containing protein [Candidatus Aenigmarchaeota archaeon]